MRRKNTKEKTRRGRAKYPALEPTLNLKTRYEVLEIDYLAKLDEKAKKWLNKFNDEYGNDHLDRKDLSNNLHNTPKLKKDCDDRNNARNRDIMTRAKASGSMVYLEDLKREDRLTKNAEEVLLEELDETDDGTDDGG